MNVEKASSFSLRGGGGGGFDLMKDV